MIAYLIPPPPTSLAGGRIYLNLAKLGGGWRNQEKAEGLAKLGGGRILAGGRECIVMIDVIMILQL